MPGFLLTLLLIAIGWALLIRPQQAKLRDRKAMVAALEIGDQVITAGGIHGTITEVNEDTVGIAVAPGVVLTLARQAIARPLDTKTTQVEDTVTEAGRPGDIPAGDISADKEADA